MTQSMQEELSRLFEQISPLAKSFNKRTYDAEFEKLCGEFEPLMKEFVSECENAHNQSKAIEDAAKFLPDKMHTLLDLSLIHI